ADGTWTYTPDPALAATGVTDTFEVQVSDAPSGFAIHGLPGLLHLLSFGLLGTRGDTSTSTVTVRVSPFTTGGPANNPPTGTFAITATNASTGVVSGVVSGRDADGDPLSYSAPASTAKGSVSINATSGVFSYTPTPAARTAAAAPGATAADLQDTFSVTLTDGRGGSGAVAVVVAVTPAGGTPPPSGALPAFPGAEGFGAYATGGRGGSVVYVTNLNSSGPGSLQWAIDQPGARYILFKVSGVINDQIHLTNGNVTIAGQTSPGGITVRGFVTDESPYQDQEVRAPSDFAENWVLQHIRIRPVSEDVSVDGLRLRYTRNAIVDHVSIGNALDEAIEISYSNNITVQNTLLAETVGGHSMYGGILMNYSNPAYGFGLDNVSLHHNVFNRIEGRLPEGSRESLAAANSTMNLEVSNNLYWDPNFFVALGLGTGVVNDSSGNSYPIYWNLNAVNNYFQTRSGFPYGMFDDQFLQRPGNRLYVSGNRMNLYPTRSDYQLFYCCNDYASLSDSDVAAYVAGQRSQKLPARHPFPAITYTPTDQLRSVLLATAGAWPRDPMDTRLMGSVASNTIATAARNTNPAGDALLPAYSGSAPAAPVDTDNDGMPDSWESANGLNPAVANTNANSLSTSYPDIEVYLQRLSAARIAGSSL
ncbi:MAG: Ig-like domain-containing protein, partial [Mycobacterium sp.]